MTYYQPALYYDDGTFIGTEGLELFSFQAFASKEECIKWLEEYGYNPDEIKIAEYHDNDIEDVVIIDAKGNIIE